jgi:hypothetical protein
MQKNPMSKLCEVMQVPKQRFIVKELHVRDASLQCYRLSVWVWLRVEIKQNHWSILGGERDGKKRCISYQFREDVQGYGHQPRYTTDNDAVKTDVCAVRMPTFSHTFCGMLSEQFFSKDKIRNSLIKSTSACSASPGLNSPTFTWREVQHTAEAGKQRGFTMECFLNSVRPDYHVSASVDRCLWETRTFAVNRHFSGRRLQFTRHNLTMTFCSILRRIPPQEFARLVMQSVSISGLCTTLYMSRSSILSIGRKCRLN